MTPQAVAARAALADGSATAAWRQFLAQNKGQPRDAIVARWRLINPKMDKKTGLPKRYGASRGKEFMRYERLQAQAKALGVAPIWHSSEGLAPPARGKRYSSLEVAGKPYGSVWQDAAGLHGSGRVY